jgi:hypothetical protein
MENLTEYQVWSMFGTISISFALRSIASIIAIWLALRIANNIRASEEDNMIAKVLGTVFGVLVVYGAFYWQMAANGATLSAGATQFVANFSTASASGATGILLIVFDLTILGMILGSIWMAKK